LQPAVHHVTAIGPDAAGFTDWIHKAFVFASSQSGATKKDFSNECFEYSSVDARDSSGAQPAPSAERE
jgi:hypothetical protein